ncbi:MAG: MFS transporter [Oscillibacter sp.]|nr:MFS transporter [Oscillibacter sp.]
MTANTTASVRAFADRRWLCLISAMVICVCAGFGYAWSVLQTPIIARFGWADSGVALAYTITVVCSTMAPLLFGGLIRRMSSRLCVAVGAVLFGAGLFAAGLISQLWQLYLFYGVISGLGVGFIYPSMMAYVVRLFPEKSGMASGLGTAAYGSGAILWAPVAAALIRSVNLRGTFCILGGAFLVLILLGSTLLVEPPQDLREALCPVSGNAPVQTEGLRRGQMVKTAAFYGMVVIFTCGLVAGVIVISQASPILQNAYGFTSATAAVFVSVFAACNMAGRFLWGSLSDRLGLRRVITAVSAVCILAMLLLTLCHATVPAVIAMGVAASCYGGFASVLTPLTAQVFGSKYITENYGVMYIVFGLASLIGPVLAVRLRTPDGAYTWAFAAAAVLAAVGLILNCIVPLTAGKEAPHGK